MTRARSDQNGEQFGGAQCLRAMRAQAFARPLRQRQFTNAK
jgi:hypothetical protein